MASSKPLGKLKKIQKADPAMDQIKGRRNAPSRFTLRKPCQLTTGIYKLTGSWY